MKIKYQPDFWNQNKHYMYLYENFIIVKYIKDIPTVRFVVAKELA